MSTNSKTKSSKVSLFFIRKQESVKVFKIIRFMFSTAANTKVAFMFNTKKLLQDDDDTVRRSTCCTQPTQSGKITHVQCKCARLWVEKIQNNRVQLSRTFAHVDLCPFFL